MGIDARTPVPTAFGWKPAKLLQAGDTVYSYDGQPVKVSLVQLYTPAECYKARFIDGLTLVGDARTGLPAYTRHQFKCRINWTRKCNQRKPVEISPVGLAKAMEDVRNYYLINAQPIQFPERDLPVDPYVLGEWIFHRRRKYRESRTDITRNLIERYPVIPTHIPDEYLFASFQQRLALLRGLFVNLKSCFNPKNKHIRYQTRDLRAFRQVQNLVESMGIRTFVYSPHKKRGYSFKFHTFLRISEQQDGFLRTTFNEMRKIMEIERVEPRECAYIKTTSPDNTLIVSEGYLCVTL
jgi:hypothetical protein